MGAVERRKAIVGHDAVDAEQIMMLADCSDHPDDIIEREALRLDDGVDIDDVNGTTAANHRIGMQTILENSELGGKIGTAMSQRLDVIDDSRPMNERRVIEALPGGSVAPRNLSETVS